MARFKVGFYSMAFGRPDRRDYGVVEAETADEAKDIVTQREVRRHNLDRPDQPGLQPEDIAAFRDSLTASALDDSAQVNAAQEPRYVHPTRPHIYMAIDPAADAERTARNEAWERDLVNTMYELGANPHMFDMLRDIIAMEAVLNVWNLKHQGGSMIRKGDMLKIVSAFMSNSSLTRATLGGPRDSVEDDLLNTLNDINGILNGAK